MQTTAVLERQVLDSMNALIAVLAPDGTIIDVNRAWREAALRGDGPPDLAAGVGLNYLKVCRDATGDGADAAQRCHDGLQAVLAGSLGAFEQEYPCPTPSEERWFLLRAMPLASEAGGLVVTHTAITQRDRMERDLRRADRGLRLRSACTRILLRGDGEDDALAGVCRAIVDEGGYRFAWVGLAPQGGIEAAVPVAQAGSGRGDAATAAMRWSAGAYWRGPVGEALRSGRSYVARGMLRDPGFVPWRDLAVEWGCASSVALPLRADRVAGVLNVYAAEPDGFGEEELAPLRDLAADLAMGLSGLRARAERDRGREALRRSEEKFRKVFRALPDSCAITRAADGAVIDVSDGFTEQTGFAREEARGSTVLQLGIWCDPGARERMVSAVGARGEIRGLEFAYRRKDGSASVGMLASRAIDIDGERCLLSIVRDVADTRRLELALRDSVRRQAAILDSIPDIAWLKDREGRFIAVNEPFGRACGLAPAALVGQTDFDIWPDEMARHYVADDGEVIRTAQRKRVEERLVGADGQQLWIETIKTPIFDDSGAVVGTSGIARDVTERRRAAEALREERDFSNSLVSGLPGLFYVIDSSGAMLRWNQRLVDASGWDSAEIAGMRAQDFIAADDRPKTEAAIRRTFESGHASVESRLRTRAGTEVPHIFSGVRTHIGGRTLLVGVGIDISDRRRAEDALRQSEQRLQAIVSNLPVILFCVDAEGVFTLSEGKGLGALGLNPGKVVGRSALEMYADNPQTIAALRAALDGTTLRCEQTAAGLTFDVLYMPLPDEGGKVTGLIGIAVDITERKRAEALVEQDHERLRLALRGARAGAWSWDRASNRATWSDENYELMGLVPRACEARYENWLARVHPDDRDAAEAAVAAAMASRSDLNVEFRVVWPDGSIHWINDVGRMILGAGGEPTGMYGIQIDITERRLAAESLARSEENLRITLNSIGDAVIATDGAGRITLMNPVAQALTAWCEDEARGRPLDEVFRIVNEETRAAADSPVRRVLQEGAVVGLANHTLLIDREGRDHPIADSGAPIRLGPGGEILGVVLVFRDQTEERLAARRLEEQEARYRSLVEQVPAVIYAVGIGESSSTLFVSARVRDILGYTVEEYERDPGLWLSSVHPDDRQRVLDQLDRTRSGDQPFAAEYRVRAKDGREVWISDRAVVVRDAAGRPALLQGLMFDVTDRKRAEHEVRRLNDELERRVEQRTADLAAAVRELESFSYTVSHDLRAPLRAINGYSRILLESQPERIGEEGTMLLQRVVSNTLRMERLIDDILDYSRSGRQSFEPEETDLEPLVRGVAQELTEAYPAAQIAIGRLPPVRGDQTMLHQIYANLIGNALKFSASRESPSIEVGASRQDGETVFFVKDNGVGFDMRYAGKLFGMFQRMHRESDFPGTGVGLALVKRLVERHHGRLWALAEPDRGATFYFTLGQ